MSSSSHRQIAHTLYCCLLILATINAINTLENNENKSPTFVSVEIKSWRDYGRTLVQCLASMDKVKCLEARILDGLDAAIRDNTTWEYSDFLLIEKNGTVNFTNEQETVTERQSRTLSFADSIGEKLLHLAEGRTMRLKLPPAKSLLRLPAGISDAVEQFSSAVTTSKPITIPINNDAYGGVFADGAVADLVNPEEGRKKKDKDKNMASLGGMAMMAMMAQLFFGKVLMIAGAAFIMAKIALLVSLLGSLKKGSTGSSSGSTDHVIVTSSGGGGGHDSPGWHRSMPYEVPKLEISHHPEEEHYESPPAEYSHSSSGPPPSPTLHKPPTMSDEGPPKNYYKYEMVEGEIDDSGGGDGGGGGFLRRNTAGFL